MIVLNFKTDGQRLRRLDRQFIVSKSKNILFADFIFDDLWKDAHKFAIFKNEKHESYTASLGTGDECRCSIPEQALTGRYFHLSVYAGDLITSNELTLTLVPTGYTTDISVPEGSDKDVFVDIYEKIEEKIDTVLYEGGFLICKSGDEVLCKTQIYLDEALKAEVKANIPYFKLTGDGDLYVVYPD